MAVFAKTFLSLAFLSIVKLGRCLDEAVFRKVKGKYLPNYVFKTLKANNELHCSNYCSMDGSCASANFKTFGKDQGLCELNSKAVDMRGENNAEFNYLEVVTRVR